LAVAAPIAGGIIRFTNSPWTIDPATIAAELKLEDLLMLNDFGAIGHAIARLDPSNFVHIAGPLDIPREGVTTIVGPGTGLGVAILLHRNDRYEVIETEGGHFDFAPLDPLEEQILARLRSRFTRVSVERIVSGPGLANVYEALAAIEGASISPRDDASLWQAALDATDPVAHAALDRLTLTFGSALGDLALAHGANEVMIVGGLANRLRKRLQSPAFHARFCAKGRYAPRMQRFPIRLATHNQPGLFGAAAAYATARLG
jgi:glucokinase